MKIDVVEILDENVRAETQFGTIYGKMITDSAIKRNSYDVEIDIDGMLNMDRIELSSIAAPSISCKDDKVHITGLVEKIEDGVLFLRLKESLIMIEISDIENMRKYIGKFVVISTHSLCLYDTHYN